MEDYNGYNPQYDKYKETKGTTEDREEGFFEILDRVVENWRTIALAVAIALPLAGLGIWIFETYIVK